MSALQLQDKPLVSVLIPCYNHGRFLTRAIESVRAQTYQNWECIILNDGSTDDTKSIGETLLRTDSRIKYFEHTNCGLAATRNRGLDVANGAYIQFLDADDTLAPEKFSAQLAVLGDSLALAYCDYHFCDCNNPSTILKKGGGTPSLRMHRPLCDLASRWGTELGIPVHCFLFDSRLFRNTNIRFDEKLPNHEDWECWMRVFAENPSVYKVDGKLATYMMHLGSMSTEIQAMARGFHMACLKLENFFAYDTEIQELLVKKRESMRKIFRKLRAERFWDGLPKRYTGTFTKIAPWPLQKLVFWMLERSLRID